jgi:hypothetical protein
MKTLLRITALYILLSISAAGFSQTNKDSLGLPGDNLDLAAVLNIFKESTSTEDFEKKLNSADTKINNLDLNHDGQVDYIRVIESGKGKNHELVLQAPVSKSESQDVAVIQLEKKDNNLVHVQIVGDETLYGKNYVVEPQEQPKAAASQTTQPATKQSETKSKPVDDVYADPTPNKNSPTVVNNNYYDSQQPTVYVNVWGWPSVQYIYGPQYVFWVSPWYWGYYPGWWNPWSPFGWYGYRQHIMGYGYYGYYRHSHYNHMGGAYNGYYGHRVTSSYVQKTSKPSGSVVYGPRGRTKQTNTQLNQPAPQRKGVKEGAVNQKPNFSTNHPTQIKPEKQKPPVMEQVPSLRYGKTPTGGVRGGGGQFGGPRGGGQMGGGGHVGGGGRHR